MAEPGPPNWDRVYRGIHYSNLTAARKWFELAIELVAAAEVLVPSVLAFWDGVEAWSAERSLPYEQRTQRYPEHSFHQTFLMLYAFAIENYCKGALAPRLDDEARERLRTEGKFPPFMKTHNLVQLAKQIGFPVESVEDEALLRRLSHAATWSGRYPVSTDHRSTFAERFSDGTTYNLTFIAHADVEDVRALAARIRDRVRAPTSYRIPRPAE